MAALLFLASNVLSFSFNQLFVKGTRSFPCIQPLSHCSINGNFKLHNEVPYGGSCCLYAKSNGQFGGHVK